jgi:AraC-like DNA-binding protein
MRQDARVQTSPVVLRRLVRARELISDAYAEPLTLERIAREAGLSRFHLLRAFRHFRRDAAPAGLRPSRP